MEPPELSASPPQLQYQWQEGVENLEGYCSGGYHPTHIGDQFCDSRYHVVHKLGHGTYSTVWLARDNLEARYVALKILVAAAGEDKSESKILRALGLGNPEHPGRAYVSSLLDEFVINGPNGCHLCVVSEAAGCSIAQSKEASITWKFSPNVARAVSVQALLGLDYIHSCGVVHADLHSNNILFKSPSFTWCTIDELYARFGEPQRLPIERLDGNPNGSEVPEYCVPPAFIFEPSEEIVDSQIIIADFGEAFFQNEKQRELHAPMLLLPPETFFDDDAGPPIDVWMLGCTLYEILGERPLFEGFMPDKDHMLAEMISTLGELPKRWWSLWEQKTDFFLEDGSWKKDTHRSYSPYSRPLVERLRIMGRGENPETCEFSREEMASLETLLKQMLAYEPSERITINAAVESEWMKGWGRPSMIETGVIN
ncbi:hypothetical protein VF21_03119 [Pseudogymnoascus sp. 05NY08]|nr:hypothetical protein VF21_03119 [Pseudogymnoascus sp. 05NY08]